MEIWAQSSVVNNLRFPGQYYDDETRLYNNLHRFFDAKIGKYICTDPIGIEGGINLFSYSNNNPINAIDPLGLEWIKKNGKYTYIPTSEYQQLRNEERQARKERQQQSNKEWSIQFNNELEKFRIEQMKNRGWKTHDPTKPWDATESYKAFHSGYSKYYFEYEYSHVEDCSTCIYKCVVLGLFGLEGIPPGEAYTQLGEHIATEMVSKNKHAFIRIAGKIAFKSLGAISTAHTIYTTYECSVSCYNKYEK